MAGFGIRSGLLILQRKDTLAIESFLQSGFGSELEVYNREYYKHDVWALAIRHMERDVLYPTPAIYPQQELHKTAFYNDLCSVVGVEYVAGGMLSTEGLWEVRLG